MNWGHYEPILAPSYTWTSISTSCDNKYHAACKSIKKELEKNNLEVEYVSRHNLFDENLYLVKLKDDSWFDTEKKIADALKIPEAWVSFYVYPKRYAIKEDELNYKYMQNDKLVFNHFDIQEALDGVCSSNAIEKQLNGYDSFNKNKVVIYKDFILITNAMCSKNIIADRLNIPSEAVTDVSCEGTNIKHIILLDKLPKGDC